MTGCVGPAVGTSGDGARVGRAVCIGVGARVGLAVVGDCVVGALVGRGVCSGVGALVGETDDGMCETRCGPVTWWARRAARAWAWVVSTETSSSPRSMSMSTPSIGPLHAVVAAVSTSTR